VNATFEDHSWRSSVPTHDQRRGEPWAIGPNIARADIPGLCARLTALLENSDARVVVCDVRAITNPDAVVIEALARLQLTARRLGRQILVRHASDHLRDLLALTGLRHVLSPHDCLVLEPGWQAKQREQPVGIEEEVEPDDPAC
jgi:anti-anti-sigma regulatory factor